MKWKLLITFTNGLTLKAASKLQRSLIIVSFTFITHFVTFYIRLKRLSRLLMKHFVLFNNILQVMLALTLVSFFAMHCTSMERGKIHSMLNIPCSETSTSTLQPWRTSQWCSKIRISTGGIQQNSMPSSSSCLTRWMHLKFLQQLLWNYRALFSKWIWIFYFLRRRLLILTVNTYNPGC